MGAMEMREFERERVLDERIWEEKIRLWGNEGEVDSIYKENGSWRVRENVKRWGRWREIRRKGKETVGNY